MNVDLVNATTKDGMRLDGALHRAPGAADIPKADCLLCLHGVGSNFYGSSLFQRISPFLLDAGVSLLWANTRGHDAIHSTWIGSQPTRQGAAYEIVADCHFDIAAWLRFLGQADFERPGILGHSLGAIKAVYSEAHQPQAATSCVIALSPPRLSYAAFRSGQQSAAFFTSISNAKNLVQEDRARELLEVSVPHPMLITAAGYLDKYGPDENYNLLRFANHLPCETLFTYGGQELASGNPAFSGVPEAITSLPAAAQRFTVETVADADHNYTGKHRELAETIVSWLSNGGAGKHG